MYYSDGTCITPLTPDGEEGGVCLSSGTLQGLPALAERPQTSIKQMSLQLRTKQPPGEGC